MESRLILVAVVFLCTSLTFAVVENTDGIKFESGGKPDKDLKNMLNKVVNQTVKYDDTESSGSGSDTDDQEDTEGSAAGSGGSGIGIVIEDVAKTTNSPKKTEKAKPTVTDINASKSTKAIEATDNNNIAPELSTKDPQNEVGAQEANQNIKKEEPSGGVTFTIGIIVGVMIGAVLAILVIVFLVYRLRKKDEGSYSLDEQSSQAFIRDDKTGQGKEYYA